MLISQKDSSPLLSAGFSDRGILGGEGFNKASFVISTLMTRGILGSPMSHPSRDLPCVIHSSEG